MEDEKIITLFFERNEDAVCEAEKKYGTYCRTVAENILRDPEDSDECLNSVWLDVWNSVPPAKPQNLKIFLAKITRNRALNKLKAKNAEKRGCKETKLVFEELSECIPSEENVEEKFIAKEMGESINRFAAKLSKKERNIFIRRYFFMETTEEIGKRYGFSANNIAVILHRIRGKLKKHLEREGYIT